MEETSKNIKKCRQEHCRLTCQQNYNKFVRKTSLKICFILFNFSILWILAYNGC